MLSAHGLGVKHLAEGNSVHDTDSADAGYRLLALRICFGLASCTSAGIGTSRPLANSCPTRKAGQADEAHALARELEERLAIARREVARDRDCLVSAGTANLLTNRH